MSSRYWKVGKKDSVKLIEILEAQNQVVRDATKLSRKLGFDRKRVVYGNSWFRKQVVGFIARQGQEVDEKVWCRLKGYEGGWRPRRNKKNKQLVEQFESFNFSQSDEACKFLGLKNWVDGKIYTLGIVVAVDVVYIAFYDEMGTPNTGREVSNLTYNKWKKAAK